MTVRQYKHGAKWWREQDPEDPWLRIAYERAPDYEFRVAVPTLSHRLMMCLDKGMLTREQVDRVAYGYANTCSALIRELGDRLPEYERMAEEYVRSKMNEDYTSSAQYREYMEKVVGVPALPCIECENWIRAGWRTGPQFAGHTCGVFDRRGKRIDWEFNTEQDDAYAEPFERLPAEPAE